MTYAVIAEDVCDAKVKIENWKPYLLVTSGWTSLSASLTLFGAEQSDTPQVEATVCKLADDSRLP